MLNYTLGAAPAVIACFLVYLCYLMPLTAPAPAVKPFTVEYTPDCYLSFPDEMEVRAAPLSPDQIITITYESPAP